MAFWVYETYEDKTRYGCKVSETLFSGQSPFQKVEVFDTLHYGPTLALDGVFMTAAAEEHFYHEMLVQPAMMSAPRIRNILLIGGGDGGSAREILRHEEVERLCMVEIDALVVEACQKYLPGLGGSAWTDPRLDLTIGDGIRFVREWNAPPFDVIFLDGCDPVGPAEGLFGVDFYRACLNILSPDGFFVLQSQSPILQRALFIKVVTHLSRAFPRVRPYFGPAPLYASDQWSWTIACREGEPFPVIGSRMDRLEADFKYYNRQIHRAAFALPNNFKSVFNLGSLRR